MPKKDSMLQKRKWMEDYEKGKQIAAIAHDAHRDIRTIKNGIGQARQEQLANIAKADLLKEALRNHHRKLLNLIEEILKIVQVPAPDLQIPWENLLVPGSFSIKNGWVDHEYSFEFKIMRISLDVEKRLEWELLQEHLKRELLRDALIKWKKALASHLEKRIAMKQRFAALLREKTGYKILHEISDKPFVYPAAIDMLFQHIMVYLPNGKSAEHVESKIVIDESANNVAYGKLTNLAHAPGAEQETRDQIIGVINDIEHSSEHKEVVDTYRVLIETTDKVQRAGEEIQLMGLVSGQCRICTRLGA